MSENRRFTFALLLLYCAVVPAVGSPGPKPEALLGLWGDQGDGTFVNPILPGDYSDIDAIRAGDDYYAISSTLHLSPGMIILHSKDLVNWTLIGHAVNDVTQIGPEMNWDRMNRYGRGVWAGAIRYHHNKFWIYFGAPDEGLFMTTAADPAGPWEPLHKLGDLQGYNDTCPFWDDDGQGYLVTTHFARDPVSGQSYNIHLIKMSADGKRLLMDSDRIIHQSRGSEASKLYKINGMYYHYYSEVKREGRVPMMNRSARLDGPWETRQIGHVNKQVDKEPNQGGFIQVPSGRWWFLTHQGSGDWEGRAMCLLPVTWVDGWPIIGEAGTDGIGNMVWRAEKPIPGRRIRLPQTDDGFDGLRLGPQWEWNHQPRADKWSLAERPGFLRLHAFKPLAADDLTTTGNICSQRVMRTKTNEVTVKLELSGMANGQTAGLCLFAGAYSAVGVSQEDGIRRLRFNENRGLIPGPTVDSDVIWFRSTWGIDGRSEYAYSTDGHSFTPFGKVWPLTWGNYRGSRVGVFTYNNKGEAGFIDVDWFHYAFDGPAGSVLNGSQRGLGSAVKAPVDNHQALLHGVRYD